MASQTWNDYVAQVKALGGVVTNMPSGVHQGQPAARYYYTTYGPKVNAHEWPMPEVFSADGTWGYYVAGTEFQNDALASQLAAEAQGFSQGTDQEATNANAGRSWWDQLKLSLSGLGVPTWVPLAVGALVLLPVVSSALSFLPRRNPRGRRHTRRRLTQGR